MRNLAIAVMALAAIAGCSKQNDNNSYTLPHRQFIAHRGVDLNHTIAGENSLEAVDLAKAAGFDAVETDVRYTKDKALVVMHDESLNRTCLNADGTELQEEVKVADKTLAELKAGFVLKADDESRRSVIPTLEEYLRHCKEVGMFVFIEPKLKDATGKYYREIIDLADGIFGRDGYIVTSNNYANGVIRNTLGIKDLKLMGILYQTTWEDLASVGNCIFAISATRFEDPEYQANVKKAKSEGRTTESSADKFVTMDMVNRSGVDWISTDMLVPDYKGQGTLAEGIPDRTISFGGEYLTLEFSGTVTVRLGGQKFTVSSASGETRTISHQVALYNTKPTYSLSDKSSDFKLISESVKVVEF